MASQFSLLRTRRFFPFFLTQFLSAFNDNLFKAGITILLTFQAATWTSMAPGLVANLAAGLFMLPFFLFSATAGQLADRHDKARLAQLVKILEIGIVGIGGIGFALHSIALLMTAVLCLGLHSAMFGPIKYAILPETLHPDELMAGNALVEAGTFAAILLGTLVGGTLAAMPGGTAWVTGISLVIAASGYLASRQIPSCTPPAPDLVIRWNPMTETIRCIRLARQNQRVFTAIVALSWFWMYGALLLAQFPAYARDVLGGAESAVTLLLAVFTIGIATGSLLCDKLSAHKVELGLVPIGALGLMCFGFDFALGGGIAKGSGSTISQLLSSVGTWRVLADLFGVGFFGGIFCVPLYALMQTASAPEARARVVSSNNIMNALFMVVGAIGAGALLGAGLSLPNLFLVAACMHVVICGVLFLAAPEFISAGWQWVRHKALQRT